MGTLLKTYKSMLVRFPICTQAIQTGFLMGSGDLIAQTLIEQKSFKKIDSFRTGRFILIGTFFVGPCLRIYYGILDKYFGNIGKIVAVKKMMTDQLLFAPSFIAVFMAVVGIVQGNSFEKIKEQIVRDYPDVLKNNYKLWPAVQLCNFYLIPLQYQVVTVQIVAIFWNTYLSWKMNNFPQIRSKV